MKVAGLEDVIAGKGVGEGGRKMRKRAREQVQEERGRRKKEYESRETKRRSERSEWEESR